MEDIKCVNFNFSKRDRLEIFLGSFFKKRKKKISRNAIVEKK